jgi:hypothetical protein
MGDFDYGDTGIIERGHHGAYLIGRELMADGM